MSIVLIDTSVFCNVVPVPGFDQNRAQILAQMEELIRENSTLLLPMAVVLETGNHIAHISDGRKRRSTAKNFCKLVKGAIDGKAPWTPTPFWEIEELNLWLDDFEDAAMRGQGMGDLSIIKEWEHQCEFHQARRVCIWSLDQHLAGYDRTP